MISWLVGWIVILQHTSTMLSDTFCRLFVLLTSTGLCSSQQAWAVQSRREEPLLRRRFPAPETALHCCSAGDCRWFTDLLVQSDAYWSKAWRSMALLFGWLREGYEHPLHRFMYKWTYITFVRRDCLPKPSRYTLRMATGFGWGGGGEAAGSWKTEETNKNWFKDFYLKPKRAFLEGLSPGLCIDFLLWLVS